MITWYSLTRGIKNLIAYAPIIWKDRDWDWAFLIYLMEFKLRRMSKCLENGYHSQREKQAKELRICATLCKRLVDDKYFENLSGPLEYRHTTTPLPDGSHKLHIDTYSNGVLQSHEEFMRLHKLSERNKKNDLDYLSKMFGKRLFWWWD